MGTETKGGAGDNGENGPVFENLADELMAPVGMSGDAMVTKLEAVGRGWRRAAVDLLKKHDPKAYATYRAIKYADGATKTPPLAQRREAYLWAAIHVLETYFDAPLCEGWRQVAAKIVEALDPAAHVQYQQAKHGAGEPDRATKIEAYRIVVKRFLELSYTMIDL